MRSVGVFAAIVALSVCNLASASWTFDVYANANALFNSPLDTGLSLSPGQQLVMTVDSADLWRCGVSDTPFPRIGNADGFPGYPPYDYGGGSFLYGTLVGQIDGGAYFKVGTSFDQVVSDSGNLKLMFWDSNYEDNSDYVTATVSIVPVPGALLLSGLGTALVGWIRSRRTLA